VDAGCSLFAWWRLLEYYHSSDQSKATIICLAEILDRLEEDGVKFWEGGEKLQDT